LLDPIHPAIEFRDVTLAFDDFVVLDRVSFRVAHGETKVVLGGSGVGKSTVLKIVLGLLKPDSGHVLIDGEDITNFSEQEWMRVRQKIGMVFQEGALFDSLSVYDNVGYRLHEQYVAEDKVEESVRSALSFVGLEEAIYKMPNELSGGMRRRVGIARALVGDPQIVLFDEPTAGLDPPTARTICDLAIRLRDIKAVSSIFVTHRIEDVTTLSSEFVTLGTNGEIIQHKEDGKLCLINTKFLMLKDGEIVFSGTDETLFGSTDPYIRHFLKP